MEFGAGRAGLKGSKYWKETVYADVGFEGEKAVSTTAAIVNEGQIYLALVATTPDVQRKGFGAVTVQQTLNSTHAATGLKRTILHATDAGFQVYERLGYGRTAKFITFNLA